MKAILGAVSMALVTVFGTGPAQSATFFVDQFAVVLQPADIASQPADYGEDAGAVVAISESEAANIARSAYPGAKVLKVKLLRKTTYAVTLKEGGNVFRVMVDAQTGAIQ